MFKTSKNHNSVKIVLDFTGVLRLLGNNSVIPLLTAAKKRHFYPPKLPALRAEVDGQTQKSVRPFSCFLAAFSPRRPKSLDFDHFQQFPAFAASGFSRGHLVLFRCFLPTLPYSGATSGLRASGGYTLGWAAKAAQTANTSATDCDWRFVCALNLCFQQNRHIFVLPHPRPASAFAGHSPAGVQFELDRL